MKQLPAHLASRVVEQPRRKAPVLAPPAHEPSPAAIITSPEASGPVVVPQIAFTFYGKVPGNNGPGGLLRMHWSRRRKVREDYEWQVHAAYRRAPPLAGPVRLELVRYSTGCGMDYDNLVSTGKLLIDALVRAGVLPDDNPAVIVERRYTQCHVPRKAQQRTEIHLTRLAAGIPEQQ